MKGEWCTFLWVFPSSKPHVLAPFSEYRNSPTPIPTLQLIGHFIYKFWIVRQTWTWVHYSSIIHNALKTFKGVVSATTECVWTCYVWKLSYQCTCLKTRGKTENQEVKNLHLNKPYEIYHHKMAWASLKMLEHCNLFTGCAWISGPSDFDCDNFSMLG